MREEIEKLLAEVSQPSPKMKASYLRAIFQALLALDERLTKLEESADND